MQGLSATAANGLIAFTVATFLLTVALWPAGSPLASPLTPPGAATEPGPSGPLAPRASIVGKEPYNGPVTAQQVKAACSSPQDAAIPCYTVQLQALLTGKGAEAAFDALENLTYLDADAYRESHAIAHSLGRHAYQAYGTIEETLANCSYKVFQGCFHGALQSHFGSLSVVGPQEIQGLCPTDNAFREYACVHGLGHGLMLNNNYDMNASLALCDSLQGYYAQGSCWGGAFMENLVGYFDSLNPTAAGGHDHGGAHHEPPTYMVDRNDPYYPCNAVDAKYKATCWLLQTSFILHFSGGDFQDAAQKCDGAPDGFTIDCYRSLGRDSAAYTGRNVEASTAHCAHGGPAERESCIRGFVAESVLNYATPTAGIAVCRLMGEMDKGACYHETAVHGRGMVSAAEMAEVCATAEEPYVDVCRQGSGLPPRAPPA